MLQMHCTRRHLTGTVWPGGGLVVSGAGFQAAVQDADEPVREVAQRGPVADAGGPVGVVTRPGTGRGIEGGEGLTVEGVAEHGPG
jgi:hypothetical protein